MLYKFFCADLKDFDISKRIYEIMLTFRYTGSNSKMLSGELATYLAGRYVEIKIYSSIILKDIAQRNKIRDIELFKRVMLYMLSNVGNVFSSGNITKYLKNEKRSLSTETIYNYIEYSKSACLIHMVSREDIIGKKLLQFQEKVYVANQEIYQM